MGEFCRRLKLSRDYMINVGFEVHIQILYDDIRPVYELKCTLLLRRQGEMEFFMLLLNLKIADRCGVWRIHHLAIGEVHLQNHSSGLLRFLFCGNVLARFLRVWVCF